MQDNISCVGLKLFFGHIGVSEYDWYYLVWPHRPLKTHRAQTTIPIPLPAIVACFAALKKLWPGHSPDHAI